MCDYISGELILCFPKVDSAAQQLIERIKMGLVEHVSHIESLEQKLARLGLKVDENFEFDIHRVGVSVGEELWKVTYLQFLYKHDLLHELSLGQNSADFLASLGKYNHHFTVTPNSVLSLTGRPLGNVSVQAANFTFSHFHSTYKTTLCLPSEPPENLDQVTIAILDSGIADDVDFAISEKKNFVDPNNPQVVTDENGHGTVIAQILHDIAPEANLTVYKVADADGRVSEWDAIAALAAVNTQTQVVNLSLHFGLENRVCKVCGRESHSSRSAVFENVIEQFSNRKRQPILVGAAGNDGLSNLDFPARYASVLAIGSINSKSELSAESNYGNQYNILGTPDNRFVSSGGDDATNPPETVGSFGLNDGSHWHGTSFAAAYATGVVANLIAGQDEDDTEYEAILNTLRKNADSETLTNYDPDKHGHGIIRL